MKNRTAEEVASDYLQRPFVNTWRENITQLAEAFTAYAEEREEVAHYKGVEAGMDAQKIIDDGDVQKARDEALEEAEKIVFKYSAGKWGASQIIDEIRALKSKG